MHHGKNPLAEGAAELAEAAKKIQDEANRLGLGPTGQFPQGKLNDDDEGEIKIAVIYYQNNVVINFGTPVAFITMTPEQAIELADSIKKHATR